MLPLAFSIAWFDYADILTAHAAITMPFSYA